MDETESTVPEGHGNLPACPNCGYKANGPSDPLVAMHEGRGECPKCGIIPGKFGARSSRAGDSQVEQASEALRRPYFDISIRTNILVMLTAISALFSMACVVNSILLMDKVLEYRRSGFIPMTVKNAAQLRHAVQIYGDFGLGLLAFIVLLFWSYRAHQNLRSLGGIRLSYSPGWSIGGWFVPIANFWIPYKVFQEMALFSNPDFVANPGMEPPSGRISAKVLAWWLMWLFSYFSMLLGGIVIAVAEEKALSPTAALWIVIASYALQSSYYVLLTLIVAEIGRNQPERRERLEFLSRMGIQKYVEKFRRPEKKKSRINVPWKKILAGSCVTFLAAAALCICLNLDKLRSFLLIPPAADGNLQAGTSSKSMPPPRQEKPVSKAISNLPIKYKRTFPALKKIVDSLSSSAKEELSLEVQKNISLKSSHEYPFRGNLIMLAGILGCREKSVFDTLHAIMKDRGSNDRPYASATMGILFPGKSEEYVLPLFESTDRDWQLIACEASPLIKAEWHWFHVRWRLDAGDEFVKVAAIEALNEAERVNDKVRESVLIQAGEILNPELKCVAIRMIGKWKIENGVKQLIRACLSDFPFIRFEAVTSLNALKHIPDARNALILMAFDAKPDVKSQAEKCLAGESGVDRQKVQVDMLSDKNEEMRVLAVTSLWNSEKSRLYESADVLARESSQTVLDRILLPIKRMNFNLGPAEAEFLLRLHINENQAMAIATRNLLISLGMNRRYHLILAFILSLDDETRDLSRMLSALKFLTDTELGPTGDGSAMHRKALQKEWLKWLEKNQERYK